MAGKSQDLVPGTLEMLVLRTLSLGRMHGYGIAQHIERTSAEVIRVEKGSLYPALEPLLRAGHATAKWDRSPTGRRLTLITRACSTATVTFSNASTGSLGRMCTLRAGCICRKR